MDAEETVGIVRQTVKSNARYITSGKNRISAMIEFRLFLVLSVFSQVLAHQGDHIMEPEEIMNWKLPASKNSSWLPGDDWDTWEASQDIKNNFHYCRNGYDENGLVVYVADFGKFNYRELVKQPREKIAEFQKNFEQFLRRVEVDGAKDDNKGMVFIVDFDGFSLKNFASEKALKKALELFIGLLGINHACKYGFIINANYAADAFIGLARPFVGNFLDKFEICGTRSEKWKPKLIRQIPASQLPPKLGGSENWKALPYQVTKNQSTSLRTARATEFIIA